MITAVPIQRRQDERGLEAKQRQAGVEMRIGKRQHDQKNQGGEVNQANRINELRDHLLRDAGAVVVVFGQDAEATVHAAAAFAGGNQGDVEFRQPAAGVLQRVGKSAAFLDGREQPLDRFAERASGRIAFKLFQPANHADARRRELGKLVVKFGALTELAGREDERHNARRFSGGDFVEAGLEVAFALAPTICSATWPSLMSSNVGMARTPYSAASP